MAQTIGIESEGMFVTDWGDSVDTLKLIGGKKLLTGKPFEGLEPDMAATSAELITTVCTTVEELRNSLTRVRALIPGGVDFLQRPRPFGNRKLQITDKPRARVMRQALLRECPREDGLTGIDFVAPWCSVQFQLGVRKLDDRAVRMQDFFNDIGPYAHHQVRQRYGIEYAAEHMKCWTEEHWCDPRRVPASRWFNGLDDFLSFVGKIPKLIYTDEKGEWQIGDGRPSRFGDTESEGVLWWGARLRTHTHGGETRRTVEWRTFPAMPDECALETADEVLRLTNGFNAYVDEHPEVLFPLKRVQYDHHDQQRCVRVHAADWTPVRRMYDHLAKSSWLVPRDREFNDAGVWWNKLYES